MEDPTDSVMNFFDEKPSDLIREHRQFYLMVNAIARRVRQLQTGERAIALPANGNREAFYIAQEEFMQDKLVITPRVAADFDEYFEEDSAPDLDALLGMDDDDAFGSSDDDDE